MAHRDDYPWSQPFIDWSAEDVRARMCRERGEYDRVNDMARAFAAGWRIASAKASDQAANSLHVAKQPAPASALMQDVFDDPAAQDQAITAALAIARAYLDPELMGAPEDLRHKRAVEAWRRANGAAR